MLEKILTGLFIIGQMIIFTTTLILSCVLPLGFGDKEFKLKTRLSAIAIWIICIIIVSFYLGDMRQGIQELLYGGK